MDYLNIGSNGFAQLGDSAYSEKVDAEMNVLLKYFKTNFPIPVMFKSMAYYAIKSFDHDFGTYQEIVLWYDRSEIDSYEYSDDEAEQNKHELFWSWYHVLESVDLESEELTAKIKQKYFSSVDFAKGKHLSYSYS
jgi:hypothetical protein